MQAEVACIQRAGLNDARGAAHKSRTHRLLRDHKQADGWNVLALSNRRWKLPGDRFGAFLEHYVSDLLRYNLGLVVKKTEYFPYIMDVDKSASKGASVGSPLEVLKVVVRTLKSVVGETRMLFEHRNSANFHVLCPDIIVDSRTAVRIREKQLRILSSEHPEVDWKRHRGREGADLERPAPAGVWGSIRRLSAPGTGPGSTKSWRRMLLAAATCHAR